MLPELLMSAAIVSVAPGKSEQNVNTSPCRTTPYFTKIEAMKRLPIQLVTLSSHHS
jgi:hypothetical protein